MIPRFALSFACLPALSLGGCIDLVARQPVVAPVATLEPAPVPEPRRRAVASAKRPASRPAQPVEAAVEPPPPNASASTWQMPWQIAPLGPTAQAAGEPTILSYVPQTGFVRGTSLALASLGRPLDPAPGQNRTVETCRSVVVGEASKVGAKEIEAASGGAEQRDRQGHYFAPVHFRITYARPGGLEVRESTMTCIVDTGNQIVDAYIPA